MPTIIIALCIAIAAWAIAGSVGALAQRLDDQVRLHQLKLNVVQLHSRYKDARLFQPLDESDVEILPLDPSQTGELETADVFELPDTDVGRRAA